MQDIKELIARWDANEGKPYKGSLIDWGSYDGDGEPPLSCMCAQGQVLHVVGGHGPDWFRTIAQIDADAETAKLLNISRAHAILLRNINDKADGAPSIVLTDPGKVLGDQWSKLLDFWWAFDQFGVDDWRKVDAAWDAAWDAARDAAGDAARDAARATAWAAAWAAARDAAGAAAWATAWAAAWAAARDAAWAAARDAAGAAAWAAAWAAARAAAWAAAWDAAWAAAWDAAGAAAWEVQGFEVLTSRGRDVFFLPMFGWASPADIPPRPADYGLGVVPTGEIK